MQRYMSNTKFYTYIIYNFTYRNLYNKIIYNIYAIIYIIFCITFMWISFNSLEIILITLLLLLALFTLETAGMMINQEAKSFLLLNYVKTEVSFLGWREGGSHPAESMGSPW